MYCSKSNIITLFSFEFPFSCTYSLVELRSCENVPYFSHRIVACTYTSNTPSLSTPALFYSDIMAIALNTINISKNFAQGCDITNVDHIPFYMFFFVVVFFFLLPSPLPTAIFNYTHIQTPSSRLLQSQSTVQQHCIHQFLYRLRQNESLHRRFILFHLFLCTSCSFLLAAFILFKLTIFMR